MDVTEFESLYWHDAEILELRVDRRDPGHCDEVELLVQFPDEESPSVITFIDVRELIAEMNFGVIAPESILTANEIRESEKLTEIRQKWASFAVNLSELRCYEILTNSTGGRLRIFAPAWSLKRSAS